MTSPEHDMTTERRQRRVRHGAGLLAGGAVVVAAAFAVPALARADDSPGAAADPTSTSETVAPPTTEASTTTTAPAPAPQLDPVVEFAVKYDAFTQDEKNRFFFMTATPEQLEAFVRYVTPPPPPPPPPPAPAKKAPAPSTAAAPAPSQEGHSGPGGYLACVRQHESGGRYNINTGNGYYGAYQFLPSTWNGIAGRAGRSDLVGVLPSNASPADQDAMAQALYAEQGRRPWAGDGC